MGGHSAGEIASSIAISYLSKQFSETFAKASKVQAVNWLRDSVLEINELIFEYAKENPESLGMGTTLVVALVTKEYILFGNIGDSSGYAIKDGELLKITYDHTLVNLLVSAGELTEDEAKNHPKKNVLMKALGVNNPIDIDIFDCEEQIEKVLISELNIEDKVKTLIHKANNRGGEDNISAALLLFDEEGDK